MNSLLYGLTNLNHNERMKHDLPPLESLKAFEAAARHLSFSLAADELCITKGAVSYQIRKLEEELQQPLFKRSVRQVYLTNEGQELLQVTTSYFRDLRETIGKIQGNNQQMAVSIGVSTYVAARWLSSRVSKFNTLFPNISVLLQHSVNEVDFKLKDVDLAIKWGPCSQNLDSVLFGEISMNLFPVISPNLLLQHGLNVDAIYDETLFQKNTFKQIPLLCEDRTQDLWSEWFESCFVNSGLLLENPRRVISDANVRVQAAIDGQGLILADDLMINEVNNGLLVAPFEDSLKGYGYGFMSSTTRIYRDNAKIFKKWLVSSLED